jgi:hypothetical protein
MVVLARLNILHKDGALHNALNYFFLYVVKPTETNMLRLHNKLL